jgi:3alpha(or 20beta)-hydroxysteroid dehydrogenase
MSGRVQGKVAIVTGAAQGMGEACARRFVAEGARVVMTDIQAERGAAVAAELGEAAVFVQADVTDPETWPKLIDAAKALGGLHILVNNVGGSPGVRYAVDETLDWHRHVMDINVTSTWLGMRAALPAMGESGGGSIVNISSIDGLVGVASMTSYAAARFAVTGMTRSVALEAGAYGVRVNSIHPGVIGTPLVLQGVARSPEARTRIERAFAHQPIPRMGKPEEIASAVLFFASDEASYCTGSALVVDGGHLAGPQRDPPPPA